MLKKLTVLVAALVFAGAGPAVSAATGDIAGVIYTTDILTQFDGRDIPSFATDGQTLIAPEDLVPFGFSAVYDDNARAVFVNQTDGLPEGYNPDDFIPIVTRGKVGDIAGYYYETDISVYVNGCYIYGYALDGKMAVKAEDLGNIIDDSHYGLSPYFMTYSYDDSRRLLSVYTGKETLPSSQELCDAYKVDENDFLRFYGGEQELEGGKIITYGYHGTPHGTYTFYDYVGNDRLIIPIGSVLSGAYGFHDIYGRLTLSEIEFDGGYMLFSGIRFDGRMGKYKFDPRTCALSVISEEYNPDYDVEHSFIN